jgi:transposase InsO family protein
MTRGERRHRRAPRPLRGRADLHSAAGRLVGVPSARQRNPALLSDRAKRDALMLPEVQRAFDQNRQVYGADKDWHQLHRERLDVAHCTVERLVRLMRLAGPRGVRRGKPVRTTVPDTKAPCRMHRMTRVTRVTRVNRPFEAERPNQLWVADFTYVSTWQGFVCVAFVVDVFARHIVGWWVSTSMQTDFVLDALEQALYTRRPERNGSLVHHSDRGSQGEFNWSSQHPHTRSALRWDRRSRVAASAACVHRWGPTGARKSHAGRPSQCSGGPSRWSTPARKLASMSVCRRRSEPIGYFPLAEAEAN